MCVSLRRAIWRGPLPTVMSLQSFKLRCSWHADLDLRINKCAGGLQMLSRLPGSWERVFFFWFVNIMRGKKRKIFNCRTNSLMDQNILYWGSLRCPCISEFREWCLSVEGHSRHSRARLHTVPEGAEKMLFQYYSQGASDLHSTAKWWVNPWKFSAGVGSSVQFHTLHAKVPEYFGPRGRKSTDAWSLPSLVYFLHFPLNSHLFVAFTFTSSRYFALGSWLRRTPVHHWWCRALC